MAGLEKECERIAHRCDSVKVATDTVRDIRRHKGGAAWNEARLCRFGRGPERSLQDRVGLVRDGWFPVYPLWGIMRQDRTGDLVSDLNGSLDV